MNAQLIKRCWAIHDSPALNEIKARGQWEAARGFILAEANASLKRVYPRGDKMPVLEEIPKAKAPFELWATIRKSSKYYRSQGLNEKGKPVAFPIRAVLVTDADGYDFKGGLGGAYRREDLQLWIACGSKLKRI
jgi:hypothetical protein